MLIQLTIGFEAYGRDPDFEDGVSTIWYGSWENLLPCAATGKQSEKHFERAVKATSTDEKVRNRDLAKVLVQYARMRMREGNPVAALTLYQQMLHALIPSCPADSLAYESRCFGSFIQSPHSSMRLQEKAEAM